MGVDGVDVASPGGVLQVVVLVNQRVQPLNVQDTVEDGVEKVVDDDDDGEVDEGEDGEGLENLAEGVLPGGSYGEDVLHGVVVGRARKRDHVI